MRTRSKKCYIPRITQKTKKLTKMYLSFHINPQSLDGVSNYFETMLQAEINGFKVQIQSQSQQYVGVAE